MSDLIEHAKRELKLSKVDEDIYGDMTSKAVLELLEVFSTQGHSGMSAALVSHLFTELAAYKNLTPLTNDPSEWVQVGEALWQNMRNGGAFSEDGGKTYTLLSEMKWEGEGDDHRNMAPVHTSEEAKVA